MDYVYVVVENGEAYPTAYTTYDLARAVVKAKHKEQINWELSELKEGDTMESEVDVSEDTSGKTFLYVARGISIYIHKLPIKSTAGGGRKPKKGSRRNRSV
jgi:hypothetical protein